MAAKPNISTVNFFKMPIKKTFETNYNGKLACDSFIHIDVAPKTGVPESVLEKTDVIIFTKDASHTPVPAKLTDLCRLPLYQVSNILTWQSHGITAIEFINQQEKLGHNLTSEMAVYFYQKQ